MTGVRERHVYGGSVAALGDKKESWHFQMLYLLYRYFLSAFYFSLKHIDPSTEKPLQHFISPFYKPLIISDQKTV